ncbi:MAG: hypothetical protein LBT24_00940 [Tannerella sp.]|nr:hypothetical protein [Tannerella sp.]
MTQEEEIMEIRNQRDKTGNNQRQTIFVLEYYLRQSESYMTEDHYIRYHIPDYPHNLNKVLIGYFSSLEEAESVMRYQVEERWQAFFSPDEYCGHFCFTITEFVLNEDRCWNQPETRRSYLTDGTLNDECLTCERGNCWLEHQRGNFAGKKVSIGFYTGRTPDKIRFKKGDIVEILDYERVIPGIVVEVPLTVEEMEKEPYRPWDYSEDSYMVIIKNDEIHRNRSCHFNSKAAFDKYEYDDDSILTYDYPLSAFVFPARLPVSTLIREELLAEYHSFVKNTNKITTNL